MIAEPRSSPGDRSGLDVRATVTVARDDGPIATVTLAYPARRLALLDARAVVELEDALERLRSDDAVTGVVIASAHPSSFCVGFDPEALLELETRQDASALW